MIVVKIELWPDGRKTDAHEIGRMYVANDGTGTRERGDYRVAVCRKNSITVPQEIYNEDQLLMIKAQGDETPPKAVRSGEVKDYPRLAYNIWRLIARAVLSAFPEET